MIKHTTPYTKPNNPDHEISEKAWNEDHTIDDGTIAVVKLSDHNKTVHDALGIDAATLEASTKAQIQTHEPASHGNEAHYSTFITQGAVNAHAALTTGTHGVGAGTIAKTSDIAVDANLSANAQDAVSKRHDQAHTLTSHLTRAHSELTSIGENDHHTKFTATEHDVTARHTLGTVVPHDALASLTEKSHTSLTDKGTNAHTEIDTHLANTSNPHSTSDANLVTTDVITNDVSISKHGFAPKAPNQTTKFLRGDGTWADTPATGIGYTLMVQALTSSPADGATVYFGMLPKAPATSANISKIYIRKAGTIKIAEIYVYSGTAGTAEAWSLYIRKNNTTDTLIATCSVSANERVFSNTGLSIAVAVGDYIEIKGIQPSWATNPLTTIYGGYIYIE